MPGEQPAFIEADTSHLELLLNLVRAYYVGERYAFHETGVREALHNLLADRRFGRVWLIEDGHGPVGYVALTLGYSIEYLGIDAFIDELFVVPERRGRGFGAAAVDYAIQRCRELGVNAVHLEVERNKTRALETYRSFGFEDHDRHLMTRRLEPHARA